MAQVREFLNRRIERGPKGIPRDRSTYRAARRNDAKISYRNAKRG